MHSAQGGEDAVASAAQALLSEMVTRTESALVSANGIADQLQVLYSRYEDAFCQPAYVVPSVWMPPNVTGAPLKNTLVCRKGQQGA